MIKFKKPMNAITQFVDVGMQFDYTVPVARMLLEYEQNNYYNFKLDLFTSSYVQN